jgi:hypothetical protein
MSNWKISKEKIEVFTHPNAELLVLGKVGSYQVVVQKGLYNDGDEVIFAPEKSVPLALALVKLEFRKVALYNVALFRSELEKSQLISVV